MSKTASQSERAQRKIQDVAREYRRAGYNVLVGPSGSDLPQFLKGYRPDLLAIGESESVVIEVKGGDALGSHELADLTRKVTQHPGWRLELIVTSARDKGSKAEAEPWTPATIATRLREASHLGEEGYQEAGFLLLWSAMEAILRRLARQEQIPTKDLSPQQLVKQLTVDGALQTQYYDALERAVTARNAMVHGLQASPPGPAFLDQLLQVAEELRREVADPG